MQFFITNSRSIFIHVPLKTSLKYCFIQHNSSFRTKNKMIYMYKISCLHAYRPSGGDLPFSVYINGAAISGNASMSSCTSRSITSLLVHTFKTSEHVPYNTDGTKSIRCEVIGTFQKWHQFYCFWVATRSNTIKRAMLQMPPLASSNDPKQSNIFTVEHHVHLFTVKRRKTRTRFRIKMIVIFGRNVFIDSSEKTTVTESRIHM